MLKKIHHKDFIITFCKARGNLKLWQSDQYFCSLSGEFIEILPKNTSCPLKQGPVPVLINTHIVSQVCLSDKA